MVKQTEHEFETPDNIFRYRYFEAKTGYVTFEVKCGHDVYVVLSKYGETNKNPTHNLDAYTIILGKGNSEENTIIRAVLRSEVLGANVHKEQLLSESEYRGFWINWEHGVFCVGKQGNNEPFMYYIDTDILGPKFVGFGSCNGSKAKYKAKPNAKRPSGLRIPSGLSGSRFTKVVKPPPPKNADSMKRYDIPVGATELDVESKLDEDFVFYLGMARTLLGQISDSDKELKEKCMKWLQRLCSEKASDIQLKRCRNIYLAQLLLNIQQGRLEGPFLLPAADVDITNCFTIFEPICANIVPAWLNESEYIIPEEKENSKHGRTYIATRVLPEGQGACAYIAISMGDEEPKWIGGGEGGLDEKLGQKFKKYVPPETEMEKILARRRDPNERHKVTAFYDGLLTNIADELEGWIEAESNETVNGLVEQLIQDLRNKKKYSKYEDMGESQQRRELLLMLYQRIYVRKSKMMKREEILDEMEDILNQKSMFDTSDLADEDQYQLPGEMWAQVINRVPPKKVMDKLGQNYPKCVVERFVCLLSNQKEDVASIMHRRHEGMIGEMKKELRKEGDAAKRAIEQTTTACQYAVDVLNLVKEAYKKQQDVIINNKKLSKLPETEQSKMYDEMMSALKFTQDRVKEEAERGRALADEINNVSNRTTELKNVNEDSIKKTEESNMAIMKNLKKLRNAVTMYETKITQIKASVNDSTRGGQQSTFFF